MGRDLDQDQIPWGLHETDTIRKLAKQASEDPFESAREKYLHCLQSNLEMVEVFPGIRSLLEKMGRDGRPMALVTSVPDKPLVNAVLEKARVKRLFKTVVTGEDVRKPKPDAEGVQLALHGMSLNESQVLIVGDSAADIQAGRSAGVITGAALWSPKALRNLWGPLASQARPDFEFQTVADLDRFLFLQTTNCSIQPRR